jgi:predicted nucleotidyltransferase
MGINNKSARRGTSLADALFSSTQQRVLGFLFGQPDRSFYATELIRLVGAGSGAVQRELARLERSGLVTITRVGNRKHYQANASSPIYGELGNIIRKTVGLAEPLREALSPLAARIDTAFIFGSVAKRTDTAASDIDLLVLSDSVDYADLYDALQSAEEKLARKIQPTLYSRSDWSKKRAEGNAFVVKLSSQPKLFILGSEESLD